MADLVAAAGPPTAPPPASTPINLRAPTTAPPSWTPPPLPFLLGTWHVTHSTLPMWRKNRNVRITYSAVDVPSTAANATPTPKLLDEVTYNPVNSSKLKTITGIDTPSTSDTAVWNWRGKGWLMIASSHWEILGYGGEEGGEQWAVTYFAKTLFTPAGVDVYSRQKGGLSEATVGQIMEAMKGVEHGGVRRLVEEVFLVGSDHYKS